VDDYSRKPPYLVLIVALALLVQACGAPVVESPTPALAKLKVGLDPYLSFAPFFIAEEEGYFAEQGLEIEFVRIDPPQGAIPLLATGELDVLGDMVSLGLLNAIARGSALKYVADKGYLAADGCTYWTVMVSPTLAEGGEEINPAELEGQQVDAIVGSVEGYYLEQVLGPVGLTLDDIEIVDIPAPQVEAEALAEGSLALGFFAEPWLSRLLQAGQGVVWMPSEQVIPDFQFAAIIYGPTLLEQNPDLGQRFMVAYLKAVRQFNEGKSERNLELVAEFTGLEQELLMEACWPPLRNDGQLNTESILDFEAWALGEGLLDSMVAEEDFWDPSFVDYANQVLGTAGQ
jgi:NitT/TauT family transport system substrate-binding protein